MKALRIVGIVLTSIALFFVAFSITLIISVKNIVQSNIMVVIAKEVVTETLTENNKEAAGIIDRVAEYPETNEIIEAILSDYVSYTKDKTEVSDKTIDLIIKFCIDHTGDYEKITGEKVDVSEIDTPETRENLKKSITDGFKEINTESDEGLKEALEGYYKITSQSFINSLIIAAVVFIGIIALLSWSYYRWIQPVGIVMILSSVFVILISGFLGFFFTTLAHSTDVPITITSNTMLFTGIGELVLGIAMVVLHSVLYSREKAAQRNQMTTV